MFEKKENPLSIPPTAPSVPVEEIFPARKPSIKSQLSQLSEEELRQVQELIKKRNASETKSSLGERALKELTRISDLLQKLIASIFALSCIAFLLSVVLTAYWFGRDNYKALISGVFAPLLLQILRLILKDSQETVAIKAREVAAKVRKTVFSK